MRVLRIISVEFKSQYRWGTDYQQLEDLPLVLAAFFKLSITDGLMLSNMNRPSSPGYRDLEGQERFFFSNTK